MRTASAFRLLPRLPRPQTNFIQSGFGFESKASAENPQPYPHFCGTPILTVRLSAFDLLCHLDMFKH
jgi:hypothetical protein